MELIKFIILANFVLGTAPAMYKIKRTDKKVIAYIKIE